MLLKGDSCQTNVFSIRCRFLHWSSCVNFCHSRWLCTHHWQSALPDESAYAARLYDPNHPSELSLNALRSHHHKLTQCLLVRWGSCWVRGMGPVHSLRKLRVCSPSRSCCAQSVPCMRAVVLYVLLSFWKFLGGLSETEKKALHDC